MNLKSMNIQDKKISKSVLENSKLKTIGNKKMSIFENYFQTILRATFPKKKEIVNQKKNEINEIIEEEKEYSKASKPKEFNLRNLIEETNENNDNFEKKVSYRQTRSNLI